MFFFIWRGCLRWALLRKLAKSQVRLKLPASLHSLQLPVLIKSGNFQIPSRLKWSSKVYFFSMFPFDNSNHLFSCCYDFGLPSERGHIKRKTNLITIHRRPRVSLPFDLQPKEWLPFCALAHDNVDDDDGKFAYLRPAIIWLFCPFFPFSIQFQYIQISYLYLDIVIVLSCSLLISQVVCAACSNNTLSDTESVLGASWQKHRVNFDAAKNPSKVIKTITLICQSLFFKVTTKRCWIQFSWFLSLTSF